MRNMILTLLFCLPLIVWAGEKSKVNFYSGDLMKVQTAAKSQGKLYFYDFVASWCTPCRWMEETTYTDPTLAQYISDNYVAAKVDIDDFDGFALKEKHQIKVLPTILVFNQEGKVVGRYEESMGPTKLLEILTKHNTAANGAGKVVRPTSSNPVISRPPLAPSVKPATPAAKPVEKVNPAPSTTKPVANTTTTNNTKETKATYNLGMGLYKLDISRRPSNGFSIQVISLGQYDNVVKTYEELKKTHDKQSILMYVENISGKISYKILVGEFKTKEEAEKYKKTKALDGFVKDLAKLK